MSNVNIGGIEGSLILDIRKFVNPSKVATSELRKLASDVADTTKTISQAASVNLGGAGQAMSGLSRDARKMTENVTRATAGVTNSMQRMRADVQGIVQNINQSITSIAGKVESMTSSLQRGMRQSVSSFATLQQTMADVDSIAKLSKEELADFTRQIRTMGGEMGLSQGPNKLAEGLKDIAGFGYDAADAMKILRAAARGADAGGETTAVMAKGLAPTLTTYGLGADKSDLVMDQLFKAMDQGNLSGAEVSSVIGGIAPIAGSAGVSLQELTGALALMSTKGQTASENGTQLRDVMSKLLAPAEDAKKILAAYGVEAGEAAIRSKGLIGVLQDLFTKTGGNKEALKRILDIEGMQGALKLMGNDLGASFSQAIANQFAADGSTEAALEKRSQSLMFQAQKAKAAWENFMIGIGAATEPYLAPVLDRLNKLLATLNNLPARTKAGIAAFGGLATVAGAAATAILTLSPLILSVATAIVQLGGTAAVAAKAGALVSGGLGAISTAASTVLAPLAAVVAASALVYKGWTENWGGIREFTAEVVSDVMAAVKSASDGIREALGPVVAEIAENFRTYWPDIRDFFAWMAKGLFEIGVTRSKEMYQGLKQAFAVVSSAVKTAWGAIGPILKLIGQGIQDAVGIAWTAISGDWSGAMQLWEDSLRAVGPRLMAALAEIRINVVAGVQDLVRQIKDALKNAFTGGDQPDSDMGWKPSINGPIDQFVGAGKSKLASLTAYGQAEARKFVGAGKSKLASLTAYGQAEARKLLDSYGWMFKPKDKGTSKDPVLPSGGDQAPAPMPELHGGKSRSHKLSAREIAANKVVEEANRWAGVSFMPGQVEQCANFVRAVYRGAGVSVGSTSKPIDLQQTAGQGQGPGFANSFFGADVGQLVYELAALRKGDIVGFRNTYGDFKPGAITHTGVYAGDGKFIHRPTANAPVRTDSLSDPKWGSLFAAGVRPHALRGKGVANMMGGVNFKEVLAQAQKIDAVLNKTTSVYDNQRAAIRKTFNELVSGAKRIGAGGDVIARLGAEQRRQINEVNAAERREQAKTVNDLVTLRLEAEGKMSEAAKARIQATADEELAKLDQVAKAWPQLQEQIEAARTAITENAQRQIAGQDLATTSRTLEDRSTIGGFQDPGAEGLMAKFPEFRAQIEAAYAAIASYIADPAEETRQRFQESIGLIQQLAAQSSQEQQRQLASIEFERQMGQISKEEAINRQAEILNNWLGGEESKRQAMLQMVELYREDLASKLEMQGEFTTATLEDIVAKLEAVQNKTLAQRAQLAASSQLLQQTRVAEQQQWNGMLEQSAGAFEGFLTNVMSGQMKWKDAFTQLWQSLAQQVIAEIAKMIVKALALKAILKTIGGFFGIPIFHDGGPVGPAPAGFVGPWQTRHNGGWIGPPGPLKSDEILAKLQTGEFVLSRKMIADLGRGDGAPRGGAPIYNVSVTANMMQGEDYNGFSRRLATDISRELRNTNRA